MKRSIAAMAVLAAGLLVWMGCSSSGTQQLPSFQVAGEEGVFGIVVSQQDTGIHVSGLGTVTVVPDIAVLILGVEAQRDTVEQARDAAAAAMSDVMQALGNAGIADNDIRTSYFNIQPVRQQDRETQDVTIIAYRVTNSVTAKVRDTAQTGNVIDAVVAAAGDLARVDGISFTVDDPDPYYAQARELAVENAMEKARQLADAAGVSLGMPLLLSEGSSYSPIVSRSIMETAAPAPFTPVSPGEQELQVTVQMVFAIE